MVSIHGCIKGFNLFNRNASGLGEPSSLRIYQPVEEQIIDIERGFVLVPESSELPVDREPIMPASSHQMSYGACETGQASKNDFIPMEDVEIFWRACAEAGVTFSSSLNDRIIKAEIKTLTKVVNRLSKEDGDSKNTITNAVTEIKKVSQTIDAKTRYRELLCTDEVDNVLDKIIKNLCGQGSNGRSNLLSISLVINAVSSLMFIASGAKNQVSSFIVFLLAGHALWSITKENGDNRLEVNLRAARSNLKQLKLKMQVKQLQNNPLKQTEEQRGVLIRRTAPGTLEASQATENDAISIREVEIFWRACGVAGSIVSHLNDRILEHEIEKLTDAVNNLPKEDRSSAKNIIRKTIKAISEYQPKDADPYKDNYRGILGENKAHKVLGKIINNFPQQPVNLAINIATTLLFINALNSGASVYRGVENVLAPWVTFSLSIYNLMHFSEADLNKQFEVDLIEGFGSLRLLDLEAQKAQLEKLQLSQSQGVKVKRRSWGMNGESSSDATKMFPLTAVYIKP